MSENNQPNVNEGGDQLAFDKKKSRRKGGAEGSLNINSLMDALTILLVFLLLTMSSDPLNVQQDENLQLARMAGGCGFERNPGTNKLEPICRAAYRPPLDSVPITITKRTIMVDSKPVVPVQCKIGGNVCSDEDLYRKFECTTRPSDCDDNEKARLGKMTFYIDKSYKEDGSDEKFLIEPLVKELKAKVKEHKELLAEMNMAASFKGAATIIADSDVPFRLISEVIYTSGMSNLNDMRFALIKTSVR